MDQIDEELKAEDLAQQLPSELLAHLPKRDGAGHLLRVLPHYFSPVEVAHQPEATKPRALRLWELIGLHFLRQDRLYEALAIFTSLYAQMFRAQEVSRSRCHKAMPPIWISDCYWKMRFPVLAKRYLMLALCEDAFTREGVPSPETTGAYFRLVWRHGMPDHEFRRYFAEAYDLSQRFPDDCLYPEWALQELDQNWMTEFPSPQEAAVYVTNTHYVNSLLAKLGDSRGEALERLAQYVLSCMPGCRTVRRQRSRSTDYDIVCSMEGFEVDFRSELGRYFVCECKDWSTPADFTTLAKFCRVLDSTKSRFGILFSKGGISGAGNTLFAEREQLKVYQDRGMIIVVIDEGDLQRIAEGNSLINLLRKKYESVRLDLAPQQYEPYRELTSPVEES